MFRKNFKKSTTKELAIWLRENDREMEYMSPEYNYYITVMLEFERRKNMIDSLNSCVITKRIAALI